MGKSLNSVHNALQKKASRELTEQFIREIEEKVRQEAWESAKAEALAFWDDRLSKGLERLFEYIVLLVLHDKDGFGTDRGIDRLIAIERMMEDIGDGRLTEEDVIETVKEEMRIAIEDDGIYKLKKNGEREKVVNYVYEKG